MSSYGTFPTFQTVTHPGQSSDLGDPRALFMKLSASVTALSMAGIMASSTANRLRMNYWRH